MPPAFYYAVRVGHLPGIYDTWSECQQHIKGYPSAKFKKFASKDEAQTFIDTAESTSTSDKKRKNYTQTNDSNSNSPLKKKSKFAQKQERTEQAKIYALEVLSSISNDAIICYTDGSAAPTNPGPTGYGFVIQTAATAESRESTYKSSGFVGHGTNNIGELWGIIQCTNMLLELIESKKIDNIDTIYIFSDSKVSINGINYVHQVHANIELVAKARANIKQLQTIIKNIHLQYIPAHCGIPGNEEADRLAASGAGAS
jgi:ribonuclease HI